MTTAETERIQVYLKLLKKEPSLYQAAKRTIEKMPETKEMQENIMFAKNLYMTVFAPVLVSFVEWVLAEAQNRGIKRLYFLARDGYQMHIAAQHICKKRNIDIDCCYLYGSRYAWRMPQFALMGEACLDMICRGGIDVTFEKVMKRGGLTEEESLEVAEELGFLNRYKEVLSYNAVMQLKNPLKESQKFLGYVYEHSRKAYQTTISYLEQEGLFENIRYALVDSGWTGSLQQTLTQLLWYADCKKQLEGFYFGLYELPVGVKKETYHTYYFGPSYGIKQKVYFSNCLYEAVYSAPHGMTMKYEAYPINSKKTMGIHTNDIMGNFGITEANHMYINAKCASEKMLNQERMLYRPAFYSTYNLNQRCMEQEKTWLHSFLQYYEGKSSKNTKGNNKRLCYPLLKKVMGQPTKEEAEAYGTLLFSDDVTEEQIQCVAAFLNKTEMKNHYVWNRIFIMLGLKKQILKDSAWIEGSVAMTEEKCAWSLWNVRWYKYLIYFRKWLKRGT